jgi:hypothetical protein
VALIRTDVSEDCIASIFKYMLLSGQWNAGKNRDIKIANRSPENVA